MDIQTMMKAPVNTVYNNIKVPEPERMLLQIIKERNNDPQLMGNALVNSYTATSTFVFLQ